MTLEEFKKRCNNERSRQLVAEKKWEQLRLKQKTFGESYRPKSLLKHWYHWSCPYCSKKLEKVDTYHKEGYDYYVYKCECGYECVTNQRTMHY